MSVVRSIEPERRPTLYFLDEIRRFAPVFLDTEVDMTRVREHQGAAREREESYSSVSYVLYTAARVLERHPEANAAVRGHLRPQVARYPSVNGKFTLDKTVNGQRVVRSAVLPGLHRAGLDEIQRQVDYFLQGDPATMPELAPVRALQRLPRPWGPWAMRLSTRPLRRRDATTGTFAVTSLAHRPVDGFYSVGGTTVTLGLGRTQSRAVVRAGVVAVAPVMRLSLTFDHRVIDGAEAADVLAEVRAGLEAFADDLAPDPEPAAVRSEEPVR